MPPWWFHFVWCKRFKAPPWVKRRPPSLSPRKYMKCNILGLMPYNRPQCVGAYRTKLQLCLCCIFTRPFEGHCGHAFTDVLWNRWYLNNLDPTTGRISFFWKENNAFATSCLHFLLFLHPRLQLHTSTCFCICLSELSPFPSRIFILVLVNCFPGEPVTITIRKHETHMCYTGCDWCRENQATFLSWSCLRWILFESLSSAIIWCYWAICIGNWWNESV